MLDEIADKSHLLWTSLPSLPVLKANKIKPKLHTQLSGSRRCAWVASALALCPHSQSLLSLGKVTHKFQTPNFQLPLRSRHPSKEQNLPRLRLPWFGECLWIFQTLYFSMIP